MTMNETWTHHFTLESSQLSGQQQVKAVQSNQRHKHQQARFWPPYFGVHKVFCSSITLRKKEPSIENITLHYWCVWWKKLQKNSHKWRSAIYQENALYNKLITTMAKLHELHFKLLLHSLYSPDLAPRDYWLFVDIKRMLQGKRFGSNEEVILETEAYFDAKEKSFYKKRLWIAREALESV